jgi:hypothetical protein
VGATLAGALGQQTRPSAIRSRRRDSRRHVPRSRAADHAGSSKGLGVRGRGNGTVLECCRRGRGQPCGRFNSIIFAASILYSFLFSIFYSGMFSCPSLTLRTPSSIPSASAVARELPPTGAERIRATYSTGRLAHRSHHITPARHASPSPLGAGERGKRSRSVPLVLA